MTLSDLAGHRGHGVILNANGQVVAHVWGKIKIIDPSFKFVPKKHMETVPGIAMPKGHAYGRNAQMSGDEDGGLF